MKLSMTDILITIANADWREFEAHDYAGLAGVAAEDKPMIAEDEELETIYILSGETFSIIGPSGTEYSYHLQVASTEVLPGFEEIEA
jgi:hypothetical protein